jgi:hypothetical protein
MQAAMFDFANKYEDRAARSCQRCFIFRSRILEHGIRIRFDRISSRRRHEFCARALILAEPELSGE